MITETAPKSETPLHKVTIGVVECHFLRDGNKWKHSEYPDEGFEIRWLWSTQPLLSMKMVRTLTIKTEFFSSGLPNMQESTNWCR